MVEPGNLSRDSLQGESHARPVGEAKQWGVEIPAPLWEGRRGGGRERSLPLPSSSGQQELVRETGPPRCPDLLPSLSLPRLLPERQERRGARLASHHPGWEGAGWAGEDHQTRLCFGDSGGKL